MSTRLLQVESEATIDGATRQIVAGTTTLDSAAVPYVSADLEFPFLSEADVEWLDPRAGVRVPYTLGDGTDTRSFDLGLRSRTVDHEAKRVTVQLASDEALLIDYAALTTDTGARAHETSLRAVCNYILAKIGASLEAGTEDADVTAYWPITNELPNPSIEVDASNWIAGAGATSLSRVAVGAVPGVSGSWALRWVASAATANVISVPTLTTLRVLPGRSYTFAYYVYSSVSRTARAVLQWITEGGMILGATSGATIATSTSAFTRATVTATAPQGAAYAVPYAGTEGNTAGDAHVLDSAMFYEGDELVPYFDGATTDTAAYIYAWAGDAGLSPSTRTPTLERPRELFTLRPGGTLWEFLLAITSAAGFVLWCDEQRRWYLSRPESRVIIALISVSEGNTSSGTDELSREDSDTFCTGVVALYRWTDEDGVLREAYDSAGTPDKVFVVEFTQPYPGPGAAAAILARRQGTGRRQSVRTITQLEATPTMAAQISLPGAPDTVGRVQSVTFDHATGFMDLGAAGLVDIIPGSIDALVGTIDSLVGTIDSL